MLHVLLSRLSFGVNVITPYLFEQDKFSITQLNYNGQTGIEKFPLAPISPTIDFV